VNRKIYRQPPAESVESLLQAAGLPTCDLNEAMLAHFFACGDPRDPTGVVGIELYGSDALLRSLVVRTGERRHGSGRALVAVAEAYARDAGVSTVYLLTETAAEFVTTLGYSPSRACQRTSDYPRYFAVLQRVSGQRLPDGEGTCTSRR